MRALTIAKIEEQAEFIQAKIDENIAEHDPHDLIQYSLEISGLGGLCAQLTRSARKLKDENRKNADIYEGVLALTKSLHYRISTLNSVLGYLGKERLAER